MGWASGSRILHDVWRVARKFVPEEGRVEALTGLMRVFSGHDCDTLMDLIGDEFPEAEAAYKVVYGEDSLG